jgi:hypothetical protein
MIVVATCVWALQRAFGGERKRDRYCRTDLMTWTASFLFSHYVLTVKVAIASVGLEVVLSFNPVGVAH